MVVVSSPFISSSPLPVVIITRATNQPDLNALEQGLHGSITHAMRDAARPEPERVKVSLSC